MLVAGFALLATVDQGTALWYLGVGMTMQNLVLAVQNSVALKDIGAASSTVAFFRSLGGTIGVSVLGAVLAHRVADQITRDLAAAGVPASGSAPAGGSLDLPAEVESAALAADVVDGAPSFDQRAPVRTEKGR